MCVFVCLFIQLFKCIHTCMRTCIHTYVHTYIQYLYMPSHALVCFSLPAVTAHSTLTLTKSESRAKRAALCGRR